MNERVERLVISAACCAFLAAILLFAWADIDTRLRRLERVTDLIQGSYPDGQFKGVR